MPSTYDKCTDGHGITLPIDRVTYWTQIHQTYIGVFVELTINRP